jgi:hypothetical protein
MMKLPVRTLIFCTPAILVACESRQDSGPPSSTPAETGQPASASATPATGNMESPLPDAGQYVVDLSAEGVSIRANQVDELELFKGVAKAAGFDLLTGDINWKVVTVDIHAGTLHAAVVELVKAYPYEIVYAPGEGNQEEVLSEVVIGEPLITETTDNNHDEATADELAALEAIKELSRYEQQQAYLQELKNPTPEIRAAAAKQIVPVGDSLNRLTDMLVNDPSPEVRIATTWSLEMSDDPEKPQAIGALVKCLEDKDLVVVVECIESLAFLGDETTIVYLQPYLTHQDAKVRIAAFEAIRILQ